MAVRQPAIDPLGETKDTLKMCADILQRMNDKGYIPSVELNRYFPWKGLKDFMDWRLEKTGISYQELCEKGIVACPVSRYRTYEEDGFATPSGKVELYSSIFEKVCYDPLPNYSEPLDGPLSRPDLAEEYPLILSTGMRVLWFQHSRYRDSGSLYHHESDPIVEMRDEAASDRRIKDGDWVIVKTRFGKGKFRARIVDCHPKLVQVTHGWWFMDKPTPDNFLEFNGNNLIAYDPHDPISSTPMAKRTSCQVAKV